MNEKYFFIGKVHMPLEGLEPTISPPLTLMGGGGERRCMSQNSLTEWERNRELETRER